MLENKLEAAWRKRVPGGIRPKVTNIPFNGVQGVNLRAMGTKRIPVLSNTLFERGFSSACFSMSNMSSDASMFRTYPHADPLQEDTPSYDDSINPSYYKDPLSGGNGYQVGNRQQNVNKLDKLRLQQELQDLRRQRLNESRELQDLRKRDLVRKRQAEERKNYRAYILDNSKETRGWLREIKAYGNAARDTRDMFGM